MPKNMSFEQLKSKVTDGSIDTVLVCFVDMQGRLMGKRFHGVNFVETSFE
ncbi:MAG: glutamine synthetase, partial [Planktomarina sp.]|nr:glutamine synthetase [Planktomarina sp.]